MRPIVLGNDNAKTALQMLMSLPLLPPGLIVDGLHEIHQYLLENGLQASFSQLVEYMEEYWMTTVGPHNVSVYQQIHRTNNGMAGFYFYLLSKMGSNRGVWQFTGKSIIIFNFREYITLKITRPTTVTVQ